MNIESIDIAGFMSHAETHVELPSPGLMLITGPNGSGKSSMVEGVSVAAFGKTLRGTDAFSGKGHAQIKSGGLQIRRTCSGGGRKKLVWGNGGMEVAYESTTKAQEALEAVIGTWNVWKRTSVFSSQDASHFTLATDAERKRLIEQLLGLGRFDIALAACRADRKEAEVGLRGEEQLLAQLKSQRKSAQQRLTDARSVLSTIDPPEDVSEAQAKRDKLERLIAGARDDIRQAQADLRSLDTAGAEHVSEAKQARRRLRDLGEGNCDKCGQPIPEALTERLTEEATKAEKLIEEAKAKAEEQVEAVQAEMAELQEEGEDLRDKIAQLNTTIKAAGGVARQRAAAEKAVANAEEALDGLDDRIDEMGAKAEGLRNDLAVLKAAETVLGTKGVRAHVLGTALGGIETAANAWLSRIASSDLRLEMRPYSEKKSGGVNDAISMDVIGAGGGYGYRGSSGGERRRIDIALLLALAEVAQAAHGRTGGAIWIDEAMDSLDSEGVERVSAVLSEMSKERTVVVISHNPELQRALSPDVWLDVNDGKVAQIL
jgi:DNA repair exonuclease SbcCD ATPase subunit